MVYSDESLTEIKRCGETGTEFLAVLGRLNAMHIRVHLIEKFEPTGDALLREIDPILAYSEHCSSEPIYDQVREATAQSLQKFYGGREGDTLDQIGAEQVLAFEALMEHLRTSAAELDSAAPELAAAIQNYTAQMSTQFSNLVEVSNDQLKKHISDERTWSGVRDYRNAVDLGPAELNNIQGPRILEKIWDIYRHAPGYRDNNFSLEDFLGLTMHRQKAGRDLFLYEKVTIIYNLLNVIGYNPDSKMKKERRFIAAMSDAGHASIASFTDYLFTRDMALHNKAKAAYEYLSANTEVVIVNVGHI